MTSRTFFKSLMGVVAAVALAPEIAFGVRLKMPTWEQWKPQPWQEQILEALSGDTKTMILWPRRAGKQWLKEELEAKNEWP